MRSVKAGARVRVREDYPKPWLRGLAGVIEKTYRSSDRVVLHVRFEDGLWQLLRPEDLEESRDRGHEDR